MFRKYFVKAIIFTVIAFFTIDFTIAENLLKTETNPISTNVVNSRNDGRLTQLIESPKNSFSMWLSRVWNWLTTSNMSESISESRTFGHIRRLKNALIPIMFKFGVISTLITILVFLALKTIFLLKALLILNGAAILAKFVALKSSSGHDHHHYVTPPIWQPVGPHWNQFNTPYNTHSAPPPSPWATTIGQGKEIHVHIHNSGSESKSNYHDSGAAVISSSHSNGWENAPYSGYSEYQRQYVVNPEHQQQQQQPQLVKIHRDDQLNYVNSKRYGKSLRKR